MARAEDGMLSCGVERRKALTSAAMVTAVRSAVVNVSMALRAATGSAGDVGGCALGVGRNCSGRAWLLGTSACCCALVVYVPWGWSSRWTFRHGLPKVHEPRRSWRQLGGSQGPCTTGGGAGTGEGSVTVAAAGGSRDGGDAALVAVDAVNEVMGGSSGGGEGGAADGDVAVVADAAVNDGGLSEAVLLASVIGGGVGGFPPVLAAGGVVAAAGDLKYFVMRFWLRAGVVACEGGLDGVRGGVAWTSVVSMGPTEGEVGEAERGWRPRGFSAGDAEEAGLGRLLGCAGDEVGDGARAARGEGGRC